MDAQEWKGLRSDLFSFLYPLPFFRVLFHLHLFHKLFISAPSWLCELGNDLSLLWSFSVFFSLLCLCHLSLPTWSLWCPCFIPQQCLYSLNYLFMSYRICSAWPSLGFSKCIGWMKRCISTVGFMRTKNSGFWHSSLWWHFVTLKLERISTYKLLHLSANWSSSLSLNTCSDGELMSSRGSPFHFR